jgi:hypothetical protein
MSTFEEILNKPAEEIQRPPPYPVGSYLVQIKGTPVFGESSQKKTKYVAFTGQFLQPMDDVNPQELQAFGGIQGKELKAGRNGLIYYITDDAVWRLKEFLVDHLGLDEGGKGLKELIAEAPGHQVVVTYRQEPTQDGKGFVSTVAATSRP